MFQGSCDHIAHYLSVYREYVTQEDLTKAARKLSEAKKHESKCLNLSPLYEADSFSRSLSQDGVHHVIVDVFSLFQFVCNRSLLWMSVPCLGT